MVRLLFLFLALCTACFSSSSPLFQECFEKAESGDFAVFEANGMLTLLVLRAQNPRSWIFEEISLPKEEKPSSAWSEWIRQRAPGHTSWSMVEINPNGGEILECYSFSKGTWISLSPKESFLATLLQLSFCPIPEEKRRKIGPPPLEGEVDRRSIWQPPLIFEKRQIEQALFDAFETLWPEDGSELSGKTVCTFFDQKHLSPFPSWIQIETAHASAPLRAIDAGKYLPIFYRSLPRRSPQFLGLPQKTKTGLSFLLKSPKYYRSFALFAIDVTEKEKQILPLPYSLIQEKGELLTLEIDAQNLQEILEPNHRYTWLLVPDGFSESYTETIKPFLWSPNY